MPDNRQDFTLTTLKDGRVLAAGGGLASCHLYDPRTGVWSETGSLATARRGQTATLLADGTVLVTGGNIGLASAELFDPGTGTWSSVGNMISPRYDHAAALLPDGRVLVVGGDDGSHIVASAELFNSATRSFTPARSMHYARYGGTATSLPDGTVVVTGGFGFGQPPYAWLTSTEIYDPASDTWTDSAPMPFGRYYHTATLVSRTGEVVVTGGIFDGSYTIAGTVVYTISTRQWRTVGSLHESRWGDTATALPDGRILVTGGVTMDGATVVPRTDEGPNTSTEIYDPLPGQWSLGPPMVEGRFRHAAALLAGGRVLVGGGGAPTSELITP
jgi:WD40 repeat protein